MTLYGDYLEPDTKLLKGSPSVKTRLEKDRLYYQTQELPLQHAIEKFYQMAENGDNLSENADDFMRKNIQKFIGSGKRHFWISSGSIRMIYIFRY